MKKLLSFASFIIAISNFSASAQGYFFFNSGGARAVWQNLTTGGNDILIGPAGELKVAFLFGTGTPLIGSAGTPTNHEATYFGNPWSAILNDPNFTLATDANTGQLAVASYFGNGAFNYTTTGGGSFVPVSGSVTNTTYKLFVIAWDGTYATPQAAAAVGSAVGWSNTFSYTTTDNLGTIGSFKQSGLLPFGVIVPEPTAISLAGLGIVALNFFRRRR